MPDLLTEPVPFEEAFRFAAEREALPTTLGHAELTLLRRELGNRALVLARVADARILSNVQDMVSQLAKGVSPAPGEYMNPATFRLRMQEILKAVDYKPEPGREGSISDLRSKARLDLIVNTETELASGRAQQQADSDPDVADAFPCWELYRAKNPAGATRDWSERWKVAASASGDSMAASVFESTGRMIARKDSSLWSELGSTDNFDDALDTDHPPFAFQSGMAVKNVNRATAMRLGFINRGERILVQPAAPPESNPPTSGISPEIKAVLQRYNDGRSG